MEYLQELLNDRVQNKIKTLPGSVKTIYDEITIALKASPLDSDLISFKFASMEKSLISKESLRLSEWFRETVKGSAQDAGKSSQEAEIIWSNVYCLLPYPLPNVDYIDVSTINVSRESHRVQDTNAGSHGFVEPGDVFSSLAGASLLSALSSLLTNKPVVKTLALVGGAVSGHIAYSKIREKIAASTTSSTETEETLELVLDEDKLSLICATRTAKMTRYFTIWLSQGQMAVEKAIRSVQ